MRASLPSRKMRSYGPEKSPRRVSAVTCLSESSVVS